MKDNPNVFEHKTEEKPIEQRMPLHQSDIVSGLIRQRHISGWIIFSGLAADKPDGSSDCKVYFETDTGKLQIYNGSSWVSTTLS